MNFLKIAVLLIISFLFINHIRSIGSLNDSLVKGTVFEDLNQNGIMDNKESGVPNVMVSNQLDVVMTDARGRYILPVNHRTIIFVSKPSGYILPLDSNNLPQFYYIFYPEGSPTDFKYKGIEPTGELPEDVNFPLIKSKVKKEFKVLVVGDPQPDTLTEVGYYRDDIINDMLKTEADFYIALGDIVGDNLLLHDDINQAVKNLGIPAYNVMGNHDMNYRALSREYEAETFKSTYGPDYYSFNYGKVHFIVLNTVEYFGWDKENNNKGKYIGSINEKQLKWLENDLSLVPKTHLVVLTGHIPFLSKHFEEENIKILFSKLESRKHLLSLAGHLHSIEMYELDTSTFWNSNTPFHLIIAGAGCGSWWGMPTDERGIPFSTGMDGSPNGYFLFNFERNQYNYSYYPAGQSKDFQIRISNPRGTILKDSLTNQEIIANFFIGDINSSVTYKLDDRKPARMIKKSKKDPYVIDLCNKHKKYLKWWVESEISTHLWVAPFPHDLQSGTHKIKITAKDKFGNTYTAFQIFEIAYK